LGKKTQQHTNELSFAEHWPNTHMTFAPEDPDFQKQNITARQLPT